tara:strand:- start:576 stop:848 length:273 start_codon:yes stop_codon:yes gene_type:complete
MMKNTDKYQSIDIIRFIDFIKMMHGAATYYQDIGKKPHEFIKESNILDIESYVLQSHHLRTLDDITWGEAMNIVLTKKFPTFFSDYGDMQ